MWAVTCDTCPSRRRALRIRIVGDLVLLNLLVLVLVSAILVFPSSVVRTILGLPFVLLFPGYVLMAVLRPGKEEGDGIQRLALSLGLSLAIVPLIGLALNFTPWGISPESLLSSIAAFTLGMSVVAWRRRRRLLSPETSDTWPGLRIRGWRGSGWDKGLSVLLAVSIVGTIAVVGYVIAKPLTAERFSELAIVVAIVAKVKDEFNRRALSVEVGRYLIMPKPNPMVPIKARSAVTESRVEP